MTRKLVETVTMLERGFPGALLNEVHAITMVLIRKNASDSESTTHDAE
jgi:hypothetical protein